MSEHVQWVGVDIGHSFHEVYIVDGDQNRQQRISNTTEARAKFIRSLDSRRCRVVMEATGVYYLDLALELVDAGVEVMVANPLQTHHFAKALGERSHTDVIDCQVLCEYARRMEFTPWRRPPAQWVELRSISRHIARLVQDGTKMRNRLHALESSKQGSRILIRDQKQAIKANQRRIDRLLLEVRALLKTCEELAKICGHITRATGFAERSAVAIMAELLLLPRTLSAKQIACHAGLDVRVKQSGTSVRATPCLSKWGNVNLRAALYMPVVTAANRDPIAKAHYMKLQGKGKPKMKALGAMMRKYLTGIWAVMKNDEPFDTSKLFACRPSV